MSWKEFILNLIDKILGDPKTRIPKFLMVAGIALIPGVWWQPLVNDLLRKLGGVENSTATNVDLTALISGWALIVIGFVTYLYKSHEPINTEQAHSPSNKSNPEPPQSSLESLTLIKRIFAIVILFILIWISFKPIEREFIPPSSLFSFDGTNSQGRDEYIHKLTKIKMILIPGGKYKLGTNQQSSPKKERPAVEIRVSPFLISKFEITESIYKQFAPEDPENLNSEKPKVNVSWRDANIFCKNIGLELPTEAQWEYACDYNSNLKLKIPRNGNYNSLNNINRSERVPVIDSHMNSAGIYGMHGNVEEWCRDGYSSNWYSQIETRSIDPFNYATTGHFVVRGGSYEDLWENCRCKARDWAAEVTDEENLEFRSQLIGFRVVYER